MARTPLPADTWKELYPAVGLLILNWGVFETTLEQWVAVIYHRAGGNKIESVLPRLYGSKTKFLRKCLQRLPALAPFSVTASGYIDQSKPLFDMRSTVTHGAISDYDEKRDKVLFIRLDIDQSKPVHIQMREWLSVGEIMKAGHQSIQLARNAVMLAHSLVKAFK